MGKVLDNGIISFMPSADHLYLCSGSSNIKKKIAFSKITRNYFIFSNFLNLLNIIAPAKIFVIYSNNNFNISVTRNQLFLMDAILNFILSQKKILVAFQQCIF